MNQCNRIYSHLTHYYNNNHKHKNRKYVTVDSTNKDKSILIIKRYRRKLSTRYFTEFREICWLNDSENNKLLRHYK